MYTALKGSKVRTAECRKWTHRLVPNLIHLSFEQMEQFARSAIFCLLCPNLSSKVLCVDLGLVTTLFPLYHVFFPVDFVISPTKDRVYFLSL